jgi:hypothetical protein
MKKRARPIRARAPTPPTTPPTIGPTGVDLEPPDTGTGLVEVGPTRVVELVVDVLVEEVLVVDELLVELEDVVDVVSTVGV